MASYAIYSFEVKEGDKSLFYQDTETKALDMANTIIGNLLNDGLTIVGKKRKQDQPLKSMHITERNGVFTWELRNEKNVTRYEGHKKDSVESYPGSFIIFDNRPDVCQIAIEQNSAFSDTDKVVKYIRRSFNAKLSDYGLKMIIKQKYRAGKFYDLVMERIFKQHDFVKKIVWEFSSPQNTNGIDADGEMKSRMALMSRIRAAMCKIEWKASKGNPLCVDHAQVEDLAHIIALSAQNGYKLVYYFYHSSAISIKDSTSAIHDIDGNVIRDFENGQSCLNDNGEQTFELIEVLDNIRKEIADYNDKIIEDEE